MNALGALFLSGLLWTLAPDAPVADAAMRGDDDEVRALLRQGADVNGAQPDGMTALHWAAMNGNAGLAEVLVFAGANVQAATRIGDYRPLHLAAQAAQPTVARLLLEAGSDPNAATTDGGATPLHFAAQSGSAQIVQALVDHGANVDAMEPKWGQTPLMFAAARNRAPAIQALMAAGADPAITGRVENLPERNVKDEAARRHSSRLVLMMRGIDPEAETSITSTPLDSRFTAVAAPTDGPRALGYVDLIGNYGGLGALHLAARDGNIEAAMSLIEGGAEIDQPTAGDNSSPLLVATINGHFDLAMLMLERGADPTLASDAGATPLFATINIQWIPESRFPQPMDFLQQETTYLELMKALLDAGVDPNVRLTYKPWYIEYARAFLGVEWRGATPFFRATHATDLEAMKLLVEYGADPNIPTAKPVPSRRYQALQRPQVGLDAEEDPSGLPPVPVGGPGVWPITAASGVGYGVDSAGHVHRHIPNAWLATVKYLVEEHGADVNARDADGYTAVHHAAARGDDELIRYLVEKGADVMAVARNGQTTVDMANGPYQRVLPIVSTIELLEGLGAINNDNCVSC